MSAAPPVVVVQDFESSLSFVYSVEGGAANDALDKGGPTQYGITQATYSAWLHEHGMKDAPVSSISHEYADAIYLEIWNGGHCGTLLSPLNACHFDGLVQHGPSAARAMLMAASWAPGATPELEAFAYLALRYALYDRLVAKDPTQARFLNGWRNRLASLRKAVGL